MDTDTFLLKDRLKQIENSFIKNGWVTVHESWHGDPGNSTLLFACLVDRSHLPNFLETRGWGIEPGSEGKPAVIGSFVDGASISAYHRFSDEGIEPLLFSKYFSHNQERYIDISEDFVNYYKLYEKLKSKQDRAYFFIDEMGEVEEVITVQPDQVRIKWKFLLEFISIREMCLSIGYDFMRMKKGTAADITPFLKDENTIDDKNNYNHFIRLWPMGLDGLNLQSWIHGKTVLLNDPEKATTYFDKLFGGGYEEFMTGYDDQGDLVYTSCNADEHGIKLTFFKKEVLDKYYNDAKRYDVDGFTISCDYFSLKIDNNVMKYVPVFVHYLSALPHKEQLYWKHYNIEPKEGMTMSRRYYQVMIEGNWSTEPSTPDIYFKSAYAKFNKKWQEKFGWPFYKELSGLDNYQFKALHIPTGNHIKSFCDQVMALIKITIDGINEEQLVKGITLDPGDKGLTKLEKFLEHHGQPMPDMMQFLRNLQALRSGLIAHRFSAANKTTKKALEFFGLAADNYQDVACIIFIKSVWTLRALEKIFIGTADNEEE